MSKVNPEVKINLGGKERTLIFNHNALFAIEETEGPNLIKEAAEEIQSKVLGLRNLIVLLWGSLLTDCPHFDVRKEDDLRAARREVALWIVDANVKNQAIVAVVQALMNSTIIERDAEGVPLAAKKETPSQETGSEI